MHDTTATAPIDSLPAPINECDPATLWSALSYGTGGRVKVFDAHGRVVLANEQANLEYKPYTNLESIVGARIDEITPPDYAAEWTQFLRRVIDTRRPLAVDGMVHGRRFRSILYPIGDEKKPYVLAVVRNLSDLAAAEPSPPPGIEVVHARTTDMGQLSELTEREIEVLQLVGHGLSTAEIARRLGRSVKTVEWHRAALGSKLGVSNRVELARIAIGAGLCRPHTLPGSPPPAPTDNHTAPGA